MALNESNLKLEVISNLETNSKKIKNQRIIVNGQSEDLNEHYSVI